MKELIIDTELLTTPAEPLEFITAEGKTLQDEGKEIVQELKDFLEANPQILAISAPQLGINKRIFCIRFNDIIKTFINPIVTKKDKYVIAPETFSSMPGKEILISRPEEITVVYYTDEFKYEDNKLLGPAARIFDQQLQLLDGILPTELGLMSTVETDGSIADATPEEYEALIKLYKQYIERKCANAQQDIDTADEALKTQYNQLRFTEDVINGRSQVIVDSPELPKLNRAQRRAMQKLSKNLDKKKGVK